MCIKETDVSRFHLFCARIANDIVTNPEAQIGDAGVNYVVPWDAVLDEFLRDALDEPRNEARQEE